MDGYTEVFAWGSDTYGQLGLAHKDKVRTYSLPRFCCFNVLIKAVSCGERHSAFVEAGGLLYTIGSNEEGRLGVGKTAVSYSRSPCLVEALSNTRIVDLSCGGGHTLALDDSGHVYSWGHGSTGALGCSSSETHYSPVEVQLPRTFQAFSVSAGSCHSAVIGDLPEKAGLLLMFGLGDEGQLGTGKRENETTPVLVPTTEPVKQVACGRSHTLFVSVFGKVFSTGANEHGQLGTGSRRSVCSPLPVLSLESTSILKVAAGGHSAALANDGGVFTWGNLPGGDCLTPTKVVLARGVIDIAVGGGFGAGIDSAFQVWTWGGNQNGELGLGDFSGRGLPSNVSALHSKKVKSLACGGGFVLALGCDVKKSLSSNLPCRLSKPDVCDVHSSTKTTSRPLTPYEPVSVYESLPISTSREVRIRPAKPAESTDIDTFIKKLEARLSTESQITGLQRNNFSMETQIAALQRSNQSLEERLQEVVRMMEDERARRKQAEMDAKTAADGLNQDRLAWELRAKEKDDSLATALKERDDISRNLTYTVQSGAKELKAVRGELEEKKGEARRMEGEIERREGEVLSLQALVEKLRADLASKSMEMQRLSQNLDTRTNELLSVKSSDTLAKSQVENTLRQVTAQLQESDQALTAAKREMEDLRRELASKQRENGEESRGLREEIDRIREKSAEIECANSTLRSEIAQKSVEISQYVSKIEQLERSVSDLKGSISVSSQAESQLSDLQDQHSRLSRDYRLIRDSLQKSEEHNKQLLEALDKRTLSKAREYREKSLNVLGTPSPIRSRSRSPIPILKTDENAGRNEATKSVCCVTPVSPRLILKEQDLNKPLTPPTFRENGGFSEEERDFELCRRCVKG